MTIFSKIFGTQQLIVVTGEEARVIVNALRRSREAMPEMTETVGGRESRAKREGKLAERIGNMIEGGI